MRRLLTAGLCLLAMACAPQRRHLADVPALVVLDVTIDADGDVINAVVKSEDPPGMGFGKVALHDVKRRVDLPKDKPGTIEVMIRYVPDGTQPCRRTSASGKVTCGPSPS